MARHPFSRLALKQSCQTAEQNTENNLSAPPRCASLQLLIVLLAIVAPLGPTVAKASPVQYENRASFLAAVGSSLTDTYSTYGAQLGGSLTFDDVAMSSVFGETRYESVSFDDLNLVGDVYAHGDGSNYCAGCNGNFRLFFDTTSLSSSSGVFGVALDIVLHTSRRISLGDVSPGPSSLPGTALVEFSDGSREAYLIPADVGFFGPELYFLGITDTRGIRSLTIGTEPLSLRHSWVIDNLTIATEIAEPDTMWIVGIGLVALVFLVPRRKTTI